MVWLGRKKPWFSSTAAVIAMYFYLLKGIVHQGALLNILLAQLKTFRDSHPYRLGLASLATGNPFGGLVNHAEGLFIRTCPYSTKYFRLHQLAFFVHHKSHIDRSLDISLFCSLGILKVLFQIGLPTLHSSLRLGHILYHIIYDVPLVQ